MIHLNTWQPCPQVNEVPPPIHLIPKNPDGAHTHTGASQPETATFASGCFWGTEHIFLKYFPPSENKGILKTTVGYTGGKESVTNPDYRTVCSGATDHAEAVKILFNPSIVSYADLVGGCLDVTAVLGFWEFG